ncbi:MAG: hypothetical protein ACE5DX_02230 [Candidatus Dojkabacteria bacterium]
MKYLVAIIIGIIVLFAAALAALAFVAAPGADSGTNPDPEPVACTLEAKLCPDGSSVGRSGPDCEFDPCPDDL